VAGLVYAMILVGGATRLTDSGLSITEWRPLLGALPPMNDADWQTAFDKYRTMTSQYQQMNAGMDMAGFQAIYWWEWWHRQLGRIIGVVFALPLLVFWATGRVTPRLLPHLLTLFALGGLQGAIGWWMVASGVNTDLVSVAPYRLMTHFSLALLIICYCLWLVLELGGRGRAPDRTARGWAVALLALISLQMALGALVAGLDAGRGYTDWPLMGGKVVPTAMWSLDPLWRNLFENEATVQFLHRLTAYGLVVASVLAVRRNGGVQRSRFAALAGLLTAQGGLGVVTLVHAAPVNLSLLHQGLGVVVLLWAVWLMWSSRAGLDPDLARA
jgi:cytochrome c oxidase assembly protein subunit 15